MKQHGGMENGPSSTSQPDFWAPASRLIPRSGSAQSLNGMSSPAAAQQQQQGQQQQASLSREEPKRKHPPPQQAQRWWGTRPRALAFLLLAALGTLGSLGMGGRGLIRLGSSGERARRQMLSSGVPASLMTVNVTGAYAQSFCARSGNSGMLAGQAWPDAPVCQLAASGLSAGGRDRCAAAFGIPKVAMMFLAMGPFPHAAMWALWFQQAGGLLPADCMASAACGAERDGEKAQALSRLLRACGPASRPPRLEEILDRQHLFSVYVHLPPNMTLSGPRSVFHGREIPGSITTGWGTWALADASRVLIRHALKDPLNQRFIMVSESCAPLYPPAVVYQQLMYERKSRINACDSDPDWYRDNYRYRWEMSHVVEEKHWRKSFQWFGVVRKHAQVIAEDKEVAQVFEEHCWNDFEADNVTWRLCYSDEHYFATTLAVHGLDEETDCMGGMTHVEWCNPCKDDGDKLHPRSFKPEEASLELLRGIREVEQKGCNVSAALAWAEGGFVTAAQLAAGQQCGVVPAFAEERAMLGRGCPLFGRKFPADTAGKVLQTVFAMLQQENRALPQGSLVPDPRMANFQALCNAARVASPAASRKQLTAL